jgi:hypothetical protein
VPNCLYVTTDGGTLWLECFSADPDAEHGTRVLELTPGTEWPQIAAKVRGHRCAATTDLVGEKLDGEALDAAMAVFQRDMHLAAPNRVHVADALAAAGVVYAEADDRAVDRVLEETGLRSMDITDGEVRIRLKHSADLARNFVAAFDELVRHRPCDNYLEQEWTMSDPAREEAAAAGLPVEQWPPKRTYTFIVVRPGGKTPHQLRQEAEARIEAAHEALAIDEFDDDSCTTLETTIDYAVRQYLRVAEAEAAAADEIDRLRAVLKAITSAARAQYPSAEDALRAIGDATERAGTLPGAAQ